jgi:hypothetical protein
MTERAVSAYAVEFLALDHHRTSSERRKQGLLVCKKIWSSGSIITIMKELIRGIFIMAECQCKLYSLGS